MSMEKVISYVNTNRGNGKKKNLKRMYILLEKLGNPQNELSFIHITGTNGKGSTSSILQSVLLKANMKVGLFTSPHLEHVNERIRINNKNISDEDFIYIIQKIEPIILQTEKELNERFYAFELLTVAAFLYFKQQNPDIVILEAGIGGRLDSTNVIKNADVSIITSIGLDHTALLGKTRAAIMNEKTQILKEHGHLVVGPVENELKELALDWSKKVKAKVTFIDTKQIKTVKMDKDKQVFSYKKWKDVSLGLLGIHQIENACLVLEACEILKEKGYFLTDQSIYAGLKDVVWPGRFEKIFNSPLFFIDGAHNEASVHRLIETLENMFPKQKFHFVVGMMEDKEYEKMLEKVSHLAKEFIFISPDPFRGFDAKKVTKKMLEKNIQATYQENIEEVMYRIQNEIPKEDIVVQFGSLYLVGAIKEYIRKNK